MGERSPEQGVKLIRVTLILFLFLTISTTILRVIKLVKQKSWGFAEDYFIFLALVGFLPRNILSMINERKGVWHCDDYFYLPGCTFVAVQTHV